MKYLYICEYGSRKPVKIVDIPRLLGQNTICDSVNENVKILYVEKHDANVNQYATDILGREIRGPIVRIIE
jgi:hypothetical protein